MPKVSGVVLASGLYGKDLLAKIKLNGKCPKKDEKVIVKWGAKRSLQQNALLWVYYTWLINEAGLKEHGFFCREALHTSLKAHFLADKIMDRGEWKAIEEGSTAILNKMEFGEYVDKIDSFICDFFQIDTTPFWDSYEKDWKMT